MGEDFERRFWDDSYAAGDHRRHWQLAGPAPELVELVESGEVGRPRRALDLGCGAAPDVGWLAARTRLAVGLDVSLSGLTRARSGGRGRARRCCARAAALPLAEATIDLVVDRGCLHALEPSGQERCAAEVARVLAPGGWLFVRGAAEDREDEGLTGVGRERLAALFAPRGLAVVRARSLVLGSAAGPLAGEATLLRRSSAAGPA